MSNRSGVTKCARTSTDYCRAGNGVEARRRGSASHEVRFVRGSAGELGKTLAARWIAKKLNRPLIVLDLWAVMSSFLGRTGNNIRNVLDYAKGLDCVLLLDEFDAIAKRRDDAVEIGELKRLVTVLLQEIDEWPSSGLLLAATNHPDLLDPAVWRRFELIVEFPMPTEAEIRQAIELFLGGEAEEKGWSAILRECFSPHCLRHPA